MSLYVIRHGETNYNVDELVCGTSNAMLTKKGIEQAKALKEKLKEMEFIKIYVSPLQRAIDTANYAGIDKDLMIIDKRIQEICFGEYEGVSRFNQGFINNKQNLAYRYPGGESFIELCKRIYEILDEIKQLAIANDVLFVCHGAVCRAIHSYFTDMSNDEIFYYQVDNCSLLKYDYLSK